MGYEVDFSKIPSATTPFEANDERRFRDRAWVAINYEANIKKYGLDEIFRDEDNFVVNAIARLESGGVSKAKEPIKSIDGSVIGYKPAVIVDNIQYVNEALLRSTVRSRVGTNYHFLSLLDRTGEYDVALKGLVTIMYRYPEKLLPNTYQHVLTNLLNTRGPHNPEVEDVEYGSITAPETENHILMIETSRYLTNQLLLLEAWRNNQPLPPEFDNSVNVARWTLFGQSIQVAPSMKEWILRQLQALLRFDFWEYQARPYQSYAMAAIQNLNDYAWDPEVKLAARMVLDYVSAKFAVSSNRLRRVAPFRRLKEHVDKTELFGEHADAQTPRFVILSGLIHALQAPPLAGIAHTYSVSDMVLAGITSYRVPELVLDLICNPDHRVFFQRFSHGRRRNVVHAGANNVPGGVEVYASAPEWLISAGGIWLESGYGHDEYFDQDKNCAWPLPSTLMPTEGGVHRGDFIRIEGPDDRRSAYNTGVAPGFMCGMNLNLEPAETAFPDSMREGKWVFFDASGHSRNAPKFGFYVAAFIDDDIPFFIRVLGYRTFGFVEIASSHAIDFRSFVDTILRQNRNRHYSFWQPNEYVASTGQTIRFIVQTRHKYQWGILSIDGKNFNTDIGQWPLAEGDIINSIPPDGIGDGHFGYVRIDNPALRTRLVLDMRNHMIPRRYQYRLDGAHHTASFAVTRDFYRIDLFWVNSDGAVCMTSWDAYVNDGRWHIPRPLTDPGIARWGAQVVAVARTSEHLDLFWIAPDGAVMSMWWAQHQNGAEWSTPFRISNPQTARSYSPLIALTRNPDQLDVFWIRPDGAIASTYWNVGQTAPWLGGNCIAITKPTVARADSPIAAIARNPDHIDVFWVGPDGALASNYWHVGQPEPWRGGEAFPITRPAVVSYGSPISALSRNPDQVDVFWIGPDGAITSNYWHTGQPEPWRGGEGFAITRPGAARVDSAMATLARIPDHIDVFWIGPDGAITSNYWHTGQPEPWRGGESFAITRPSAARVDSSIATVSRIPDQVDVFWIEPNGAIASNYWHTGQTDPWRGGEAFPVTRPNIFG